MTVPDGMSSRRELLIVGAIAFAVRICGVVLSQRMMPVVAADTTTYMSVARNLVAGNGFMLGTSALEGARIPPVFPIWLATLIRISGDPVPLWLIGIGNALFRAIACVALFAVTSRYFGRSAAVGAAVVYLIDPWESLWVGYVLKESIGIAFLLLSVWLLTRALDRQTIAGFVAAGALIGLATLTRWANGALWLAALILLLGRAHRWRNVAVLSVTMLAVLSPWLVRNWRVTGQPVLSPHFVGQKLYTSNDPDVEEVTDGYYAPRGVDERVINGSPAQQRRPFDRDLAMGKLTIRHLRDDPGAIPRRLWAKIVNMWRPTFRVHSRANLILLAIPYCVLMLLSLAGIAMVIVRRIPCPVLCVTLGVLLLIHLLFRGEIRNRQYLTPLFYAFAGVTISSTWQRVRARG